MYWTCPQRLALPCQEDRRILVRFFHWSIDIRKNSMPRVAITIETYRNRESGKVQHCPVRLKANFIYYANPEQASNHQHWCNYSSSWKYWRPYYTRSSYLVCSTRLNWTIMNNILNSFYDHLNVNGLTRYIAKNTQVAQPNSRKNGQGGHQCKEMMRV